MRRAYPFTFWIALLMPVFLMTLPARAQATRDFLTAAEVDQLRLVQEPNERLKLYSKFALIRLDEIEQMVASTRAGRATFIHDLLEDYTRVVEAIDTVTDDALARKTAVDLGVAAVSSSEKDFLERLEKIRDSKPKDLARYDFVLRDAIDTTSDSLELNQEDLKQRTSELASRQQKEKDERQANMTPAEAAEQKAQDQKTEDTKNSTPKRKPPTLRRPGEVTLPGQEPPAKK